MISILLKSVRYCLIMDILCIILDFWIGLFINKLECGRERRVMVMNILLGLFYLKQVQLFLKSFYKMSRNNKIESQTAHLKNLQ
mgnify:FL=1